MNTKRYIFASLGAFAFIFVFEWIFHGMYLKQTYLDTQFLWRAEEDCIFWAMLAGQLLFPFIFTFIFLKGYENKGLAEGVRYGILIGLLFVPTNLIYYAVQPLPGSLIAAWSIGGILEMAVCGAIVAGIYRP